MPSTAPRLGATLVGGIASLTLAFAGCGGDEEPPETSGAELTGAPAASAENDPESKRPGAQGELEPPPCPGGLEGCERAAGTILYVERVDPDGDGDAHFVLASPEGVTATGISVIDVAPELRPDPLPGPGDLLAAAGPVFEGSYGQRQIQAEAIEFKRVR